MSIAAHKGHRLAFWLVVVSLYAWAGAGAVNATELDPIKAFEQATIGDAVGVEGLDLHAQGLNLVLEKGVAAPLLAGEEMIGFFFKGTGRFVYVSKDPVEYSAIRFTVDKATGAKTQEVEQRLEVIGPVDQVLVWTRAVVLPTIEGGKPEECKTDSLGRICKPVDLDEFYPQHRKIFDRNVEAASSHLFAQQTIDAPRKPVIVAEIRSGKDELVYRYDSVQERAEELQCLRKTGVEKETYPIALSRQPIGSSLKKFQSPLALLTHLDLDLVEGEKQAASLTATVTVQPMERDQRIFRFELTGSFIDQNDKRRNWKVKSVHDEGGDDVSHRQAYNEVIVALPEAAKQNTPVELTFEIEGRILMRYDGNADWFLWGGSWFPQFDGAGTFMTVHATVKTPKPLVPVAAGTTITRAEGEEFNSVEAKIDHPVHFYTITAGKYTLYEEERDGLVVRTATTALSDKKSAKKIVNLAHGIVDYYESWLGPFPFEELQIIEVRSLGFGIAPPATMFITREAFDPWFNQIWSKGINHRFAHEIAHQYWGHQIKWSSPEEQWLSEAFAEYSSGLALKQLRGQRAFDELLRAWQSNALEAGDRTSIAMANRILGTSNNAGWVRTYLLYDKGALVLLRLQNRLGSLNLARFLNAYVKALSWKFGNTEEMVKLLGQMFGEDYSDVFEDYYWGLKTPRVKNPGSKKKAG